MMKKKIQMTKIEKRERIILTVPRAVKGFNPRSFAAMLYARDREIAKQRYLKSSSITFRPPS